MWWLIFSIFILISLLIILWLISPMFKKISKKNNRQNMWGKTKSLKRYELNGDFEISDPIIPVFSSYLPRKGLSKNPYFLSPKHETRSFGHALIVGGSGRGKTTKVVEPIIIFNAQIKNSEKKPSMVIPDSKPGSKNSLYNKYYSYLVGNGYDVKVIKLFNEETKIIDSSKVLKINSNFFNPLISIWRAKDNIDLLQEEIDDFVSIINPTNPNDKDKYWSDAAGSIIKGYILYMVENLIFDENKFTISNLANLLNVNFEEVALDILNNEKKYPRALEKTKNYINSLKDAHGASKELKSIITTIQTKIVFFQREIIKIISSNHQIEFEEINKKPTVVFIQSEFKSDSENMFTSLFFTQLTNWWMKSNDRRHLINLLDEFNNLAKIEKLSYYLDKGREFQVWFVIFLQSLKKFEELYGHVDQFLSNFYIKLILGTESNFDIRTLFGDYKVEELQESTSSSNTGHNSISQSEKLEESVNPFDVKTIKGEYLYYILRGSKPKVSWLDIVEKIDFIEFKKTEYFIENEYFPQEIIKIKSHDEIENEKLEKIELKSKIEKINLKLKDLNLDKSLYLVFEKVENNGLNILEEKIQKIISSIEDKTKFDEFKKFLNNIDKLEEKNGKKFEQEKRLEFDKLKQSIANDFKTMKSGKEAKALGKEVKEKLDTIKYNEFKKNPYKFWNLVKSKIIEFKKINPEQEIFFEKEIDKKLENIKPD